MDDAWLYGHTARDPDLVGFVPKNCVERLGPQLRGGMGFGATS